jgi:hypothetical protein
VSSVFIVGVEGASGGRSCCWSWSTDVVSSVNVEDGIVDVSGWGDSSWLGL